MEAGSAALRVDWPVYPRRAEHNTIAEGGNRRWAEAARLPAKLSGACDIHPDQSQDDRRIVLARTPHRPEPVHRRGIEPDQAFAPFVGLGLEAHGPDRKRPGNRLERRDAMAMRTMPSAIRPPPDRCCVAALPTAR